jgi:hypothetical protein
MLVIPQLGSDPQFFSLDTTLQDVVERVADLVLIAVHGCTIEMAVSNGGGSFHCCRNFGSRDMI